MIGISIREDIGIGDKVQFSSLPENYFMSTGEKIFDSSKCWIFDHNPYVERNKEIKPSRNFDLWNFPNMYEWPRPRTSVYLSNAEIWASLLGVKTFLNRPRLYKFEGYPYEKRDMILFHTSGRSHGKMPSHVIDHVVKKYGPTGNLFHIGSDFDPEIKLPKIKTDTLWELAEVISKARLFIGVDSGPAWIAACYSDVVVKKVRLKKVHGQKEYKDWIPLEIDNHHSHWDDRAFSMYNTSEGDVGFLSSYLKL